MSWKQTSDLSKIRFKSYYMKRGCLNRDSPLCFLFEAELKSARMRLSKMKKAEFTFVNEHFCIEYNEI